MTFEGQTVEEFPGLASAIPGRVYSENGDPGRLLWIRGGFLHRMNLGVFSVSGPTTEVEL